MNPIERLRTVLGANALVSGLAGLGAAVAAEPVADLLGTDHTGIVRIVGIGLVLFALDLVILRAAPHRWLVAGSKAVAGADAAWSVGTVVVALSGTLDPVGVAVVLATGVMTAEFAYLEWTGAVRSADAAPLVQEAVT